MTLWTAARQASLSITNSWSLLKIMSIESVMPSNHLIFYCPLLLPLSIFLSIKVFSNESVLCIRWPKSLSLSFHYSPPLTYIHDNWKNPNHSLKKKNVFFFKPTEPQGKSMTKLDSILKSRDITLSTKVYLVKAMVFPVVCYGCESWTIKKTEW